MTVPAGATVELRLRLRPVGSGDEPATALGAAFDEVVARRRAEADEFYGELTPATASPDEALVMRQAFAGMLWSKQLYYYDVARWLDGDPTQPRPPESRRDGRNARWRDFDAFDIMSMPDKWEYPWFAAWDLAFHCVALAHVDPAFAKYQLILICREWFQHPNGALPAYEWDFGDVNPPVQAWAALEVFVIDGGRDIDFLSQVFDKLMVNFTWWVNREDATGSNLFEGGFLGLDNIGPLDRSHLPVGGTLQQADATGWMASYALAMATIAIFLQPQRPPSRRRPRPEVPRAFRSDPQRARGPGAVGRRPTGCSTTGWSHRTGRRCRSRSAPWWASSRCWRPRSSTRRCSTGHCWSARASRSSSSGRACTTGRSSSTSDSCGAARDTGRLLLGVVGIDRLERLFGKLFDEAEFLSPHGLRAISAYHREHPYELEVEGVRARDRLRTRRVDHGDVRRQLQLARPAVVPAQLPGRSARWSATTASSATTTSIEYPTGLRPAAAARARSSRTCASGWSRSSLVGPDGRRPCFGGVERLQNDPAWKDNLVFNEYFHGDNGAGLGAAHQTGWTGLVADLIRRQHGAVPSIGDALRAAPRPESPRP